MTVGRLFGTDGIRGVAGEPPLDPATMSALGRAVGAQLGKGSKIVLGGDTRASTEEIMGLLAGALAGGGVEVLNAGVIPTPGIAWLVGEVDADAGIVVSASHNPWRDNGIKLLSSHGRKLNPEIEAEIEDLTLARIRTAPAGADLPAVDLRLRNAYRDHLIGLTGDAAISGLALVLDAAHGAAAPIAAEVFSSCGAEVVSTLGDRPDGTNINRECGSTHPQRLQKEVVARGANLGIAFDGDADRAILVDETGAVRDGDAILYLWARWLLERGELQPPAVVVSSMSNLGLERALAACGVDTLRCEVGDRAVVETLTANDLRLGGEQSGHVVDLQRSTTGDGLLTGMTMASLVAAARTPLSQLLRELQPYPQLLLNVAVAAKPPLDTVQPLMTAIRQVESELGDEGRLVVRYSGTEPLLRIMIEAADEELIHTLAGLLARTARDAIAEALEIPV